MYKKLKFVAFPCAVFILFLIYFHYAPRVVEEHFNILLIASALTPLVLILSQKSLNLSLVQSTTLQAVYLLYGVWYWEHRDALSDHYFSFENPLRIGLLLKVFAVSLLVTLVIRYTLHKFRNPRLEG